MRRFISQKIKIRRHYPIKRFLGLLILISLPFGSFAIQQINKQWSLFTLSGNYKELLYTIEPQLRLFDQQHGFQQFLANAGIGYKTTPNLQIWFGQTISFDSQDAVPGSVEEYRIWQQVLYKHSFYSAQLISRTRIEERKSFFFPDWAYRFRERLLINKPIANNLSLVISDELFINMNKASWIITGRLDQNRAYLGLEQRLSPRSYLGVGYMSQYLSLPITQVDRVVVLSWRLDLDKQP